MLVLKPPAPKPVFAARHELVYHGARIVARAISHTFAKRIAAALNEHKPNARGV
jgi:hypothetical protein